MKRLKSSASLSKTLTGMRLLILGVFFLAITVLPIHSNAVLAQDNVPSNSIANPGDNSVIKLPDGDGKSFSLDYFLQLVDKNYPKLQGADVERRIASAKRLEKSGAFDPILSSVNEYLRVQDIFTPGKAKDAVHNESRVDLLTRSGIRVFTGMRLNPNDTKTPFVPTGKSGEYFAGLSVPVLRGLRINEKSAAEQQAKIGEPIALQNYGLTRLDVLLKAAVVYWDLVGAKARVEIARNLLLIAEARVDQIKGRVEKGDLPALDIAESEQEIQRRQAALVKSEREFQKNALSLSVFLWDENGSPRIIPGSKDLPSLQPEPRRMTEAEWMEGRNLSLQRRPELKKIALEKEQAKVELRLAENMILPAVDAYVTQGADTGPQGIGPIVRGGVAVSAPLRQRTARGQALAARLKLQKLSLEEKAERLRIQAEVDDTVSAINTSYERWAATQLEVKKAKQVEQGERLRFGAGDSTLFLVNQRERASAEAQMRLAEVHVEYLQSMAAFRAVTCRL